MGEIIRVAIGAIVDRIISLITANKSQRRKEQRENEMAVKKEQEEIFRTRPEMTIVEYKNYLSRTGYGIKQKCDIELFVAHIENVTVEGNDKKGRKKQERVRVHYNFEDLNSKDWCCVIYTFKNVGKTDISTTNIICNFQKDTCIFPTDAIGCYIGNNLLSYSECYDRKIRVGETWSLKLCYHKDRVVMSAFSASMSIGMQDDCGHYWQQPLFAPTDRVYDSKQVTWKEYRSNLLPNVAIDCFKNPWKW